MGYMILLINTADEKKVFLGLVKQGKLLAKKEFLAQYQQAEKLLLAIDKLLKVKKYKLKDVKGIVVVSGPGPFTALRIGVVTANTLAFALKIPVAGIKLTEFTNLSSLVKMSEQKIKKGKVGNIIEPFYNKEPNITFKKVAVIIGILILLIPAFARAGINIDSDNDGLSDEIETRVYYTDPNNPDTDGDGYNDKLEILNGYSPHFGDKKRLFQVDSDNDGLNDHYELYLKSDLKNPDSNNNGIKDGEEFNQGLDPTKSGQVKLEKLIEVNLKTQRLKYFLGPVRLNEFVVSTGKASMPTPVGEFKITKKLNRAWSSQAGLWMPYWMQFSGANAFHELPEWPNGTKEGANHLGIPVSHGCIRLGIGPAKQLYDWAPVGTKVVIHK